MAESHSVSDQAWLDASSTRNLSDVALGSVLLIAGAFAISNSHAASFVRWGESDAGVYPALLGGLMLMVGTVLIVRGSLFGRTRPKAWSLKAFVTIAVTLIVMDIAASATAFLLEPGLLGFPPPGSEILLQLGPPETALLFGLGLAVAVALARQSHIQAVGMALIGLVLATVGLDGITGAMRLTMGVEQLIYGIDPIVMLLGIFVLADSVLCLISPTLLLATYARQMDGWLVPRISTSVALGLRAAALVAIAGSCYLAMHVHGRAWEIGLLLCIGLFGVACKVLSWNRLVLFVALSRGDVLETSLRQSMLVGDPAIFVRGPISVTVVVLTGGILLFAALRSLLRARTKTPSAS